MSSAANASSALSIRYAGALIDLAQQNKALDKVEKDLSDLRAMLGDSADLSLFINSPLIGKDKQEQAILAIADKAKFQDLTKNFLGTLAKNSRLVALPGILTAFQREISKRRGEVSVNVQVAQDMSPKQQKALQDAIAKSIGTEVQLNITVEPAILGGLIVTVGSYMIDDSVARKLERLQATMSKQANENIVVNIKEAK